MSLLRTTTTVAVATVLAVGAAACSGGGGSAAPASTGSSAARTSSAANGRLSDEQRQQRRAARASVTPPVAPPIAEVGRALPDSRPVTCPTATALATGSEGLRRALAAARPGTVIKLADGTYDGEFVASASGTRTAPIFLCGTRKAVLTASGPTSGYVFHLDHASYWRLIGFTVTHGQKGVVVDGSTGSVVQGLLVEHIGDEGIHLRDATTSTVVLDNEVQDTGLRREKFGEGIYVGTANSNWCTISNCRPDTSDRNVVRGNTIWDTTAESIDIKEGTTGGWAVGNSFDGSRLSGADSWVDVKGNGWLIQDNRGSRSPGDGYQTHEVFSGWGTHNVFRHNTAADVRGQAYRLTSDGNAVS
jgi:hypothetical protein